MSRVVVGACALLGTIGLSTTGAAAAAPAKHHPGSAVAHLQARALADMRAKAWVHAGVHIDANGEHGVCSYVSGPREGRGVCVASGGARYVEELAPSHTVFLRANAKGLTLLGFSSSQQHIWATKWLAFTPKFPNYRAIASGFTISSLASEAALHGKLTVGRTRVVDGVHVRPITGAASAASGWSGPATLEVTTGPHPLPVRWSLAHGVGRMDFSHWKAPAHITFPKRWIVLIGKH